MEITVSNDEVTINLTPSRNPECNERFYYQDERLMWLLVDTVTILPEGWFYPNRIYRSSKNGKDLGRQNSLQGYNHPDEVRDMPATVKKEVLKQIQIITAR